jgi:8-oxoguanine deaminase
MLKAGSRSKKMRILIKNISYLATFDRYDSLLTGCDLLIEGNQIASVAEKIEVQADKIIEGDNMLVMPGMVNTHHHLYQTLCRNIPYVQDEELFTWLINLYEVWRELIPEAVRISTLVGLGELLLTGCTTSTDLFYVFPQSAPMDFFDYEIAAAKEIGIRFHPCRGSMSRGKTQGGLPPDDVVQSEEQILADCERVINKYHDASPFSMLRIALGPCSPFSVTPKLLQETIALARRYKVKAHTHLAETKDEEEYCLKNYGKRPFAFLRDLGWSGEDVWFAHCIYLNESEIAEMGRTKTGVAHCPVSNMRLGSGIAPVPEMLRAGVPVSLAVDGSASNDSSDMLGEARSCLLVHRLRSGAKGITALEVLKIAIQGGAKVLGYDTIGSLETGKAADLIMINMNKLGYAGAMHDPLAALVFCGDSHLVDLNMVNGEILVENGKLTRFKEEQLIKDANRIAALMVERAATKTGINFKQKNHQFSIQQA